MKHYLSTIAISILVVVLSSTPLSYASSIKRLISPPRSIHIQQIESSLLITWAKPIRHADGFRIYRSNSNKNLGKRIAIITDSNANSFTDSSVKPNVKYYYVVRSFLKTGSESPNKAQVSKIVKISQKVVTPLTGQSSSQPLSPIIPMKNNDTSDTAKFDEEIIIYNERRSYKIQSSNFTYYFDVNLFPSDNLKNQYIAKYILLNQGSYDFVKNYFGFEPTFDEKIIASILNDQGNPYSYSNKNTITNLYTTPISSQDVNNLIYGNSHELVHLFLSGSYPLVGTGLWEEGLANYMEHYERDGNDHEKWGFICGENGWTPINGTLVPYSDFSIIWDSSSDFFSPMNPSSYYRSGECFWIYIKEQFGENQLKEMVRRWNEVRHPVQAKKLFQEIVFPIAEVDLRELIKTRYNFEEK